MIWRPKTAVLSAMFLGIGILIACFLPATAIVVIMSVAIIVVGFWCLKC